MTGIELLQGWMKQVGIGKEALDDSGRVCAFVFNNELPVSVEAPAYCDDIFIIIELTEIGRGEIRRKRIETAMKLNAYALETRGGVLGWDSVGERLVLSYRATTELLTVALLDNMVSNLLEVAEQLQPVLAMEKEKAVQEKLANDFDHMFKPISP
ncbi:CesT family type III secretion system chaperone [Endozoicomonas arenosclerae]|uniref:CesT family type III secretion system chaperone n=1 Tax=Endozoicomonas arenosclerae TaxID=1633495 RepID=UPI0009A17FAA|nr:CesT family type III secretion system chaperone [Endozoicomonas arenosclerae]